MAKLECQSAQRGVPSQWVEVAGITEAQVTKARANLDELLTSEGQVSDAVAKAFNAVTAACPNANPSDLWQHVIYRHLLSQGWSDNRWKRVSGFALERAFVAHYTPLLVPHQLRMRILTAAEANILLQRLGITEIKATKVDLFLEGKKGADWMVFGAAHVKSSIAERIQDDAPASLAFMKAGLLSVALTMDSKSYPPPHGNCINYGELGGRSHGVDKVRLKRGYIEEDGQFDALFSFNLRTPPSGERTASGKRIYTLSFNETPDPLVAFLRERWAAHTKVKAVSADS